MILPKLVMKTTFLFQAAIKNEKVTTVAADVRVSLDPENGSTASSASR